MHRDAASRELTRKLLVVEGLSAMKMRYALAVLIVCITGLLAACASTHNLKPQASLQSSDQLETSQSLAAVNIDEHAWPRAKWWERFADPQLNQLVEEALSGSPTLRIAEARTRAALAQAGIADSNRYPSVAADLDSLRAHFPSQFLTPPPFAGHSATVNSLQTTLSWELDFWGKNQAAYRSALGEAKATQIDALAARLALSVEVARAYVQLQRGYMQLDVAQDTLKQREQIYRLTRERNAAGLDSELEVKQAESALPAARERITQLTEMIALTRDQLAALLGKGPDRGLAITRPAANALAEPSIPTSVPSELLGHRPDIVANRLRVEASGQAINSAKAEFYPNVNLLAFAGFQVLGPESLLSSPNREYGGGAALSLPIFDAGRRRANLARRDAEYDIAVERYNQTLADALKDVVDQLASFRSLEQQREEQRQGLATAQKAYDLAVLRYREGVGSYLQVLTTESQLLIQRSLDADLRARTLDLSINLARALGGGTV